MHKKLRYRQIYLEVDRPVRLTEAVRRCEVKWEAIEGHAIRGGRRSDSSVVLAGVTENHVRFQFLKRD